MVHPYDPPESDLYAKSCETLWVTHRAEDIMVLDARKILSVVGVVPFPQADGRLGSYDGRVVE